jgi:hypothetical protein
MPFGPSPGEQDRNLALFQAKLIASGGNTPEDPPGERSERLYKVGFLWTLTLLAVVGVVTWLSDSTLATAVVAGLTGGAVLCLLAVKRNAASREGRVDDVALPPRAQSH